MLACRGLFRVVHEIKTKDAPEERDNWVESFDTAIKFNSQLGVSDRVVLLCWSCTDHGVVLS